MSDPSKLSQKTPRRKSNGTKGAGTRSVLLRMGRLEQKIKSDPRYGSIDAFKKLGAVLSRTVRESLFVKKSCRRATAVALARNFDEEPNYFISPDASGVASHKHIVWEMRSIMIRRIVSSELMPIPRCDWFTANDRNVLDEVKQLKTLPQFRTNVVDEEHEIAVCVKLCQDGFLRADETRENFFRIYELRSETLHEIIEHRVEVEMIQVRKRLREFAINQGEREAFLQRLRAHYTLCEAQVGNGHGYRDAELAFHEEIAEPEDVKANLRMIVQAADQAYMKWRALLKLTYGEDSPNYSERLSEFNRLQLSDFKELISAYTNRRPSATTIRNILCKHAERQLELMPDIDKLSMELSHSEGRTK